MQTSPPVAITTGQPVTLNTPDNQPYGQVVISNLSPYLLQIVGGIVGGTTWLEPFTAMLYQLASTHAPVTLQAQSLMGTTASTAGGAQVQATWYNPTEQPAGQWPVSLTAQAIVAAITAQTQQVSITTGTTDGSGNATRDVALSGNYRALYISGVDLAALPGGCSVIGDQSGITYPVFDAFGGVPLQPAQAAFKCPLWFGLDTSVTVHVHTTIAAQAFAIGADTAPSLVDVSYPQNFRGAYSLPADVVPYGGVQSASTAAFSGTTVTLLAAAGGNLTYRLHSWGIDLGAVAANGGASIQGAGPIDSTTHLNQNTISGFGRQLGGQLDPGPITWSNFLGVTLTGFVRYDVVQIPSIT